MWFLLSACRGLTLAALLLAVYGHSCLESWSENSCHLFSESMDYMDRIYDPDAGYLSDPTGATALRHNTRASVWYAVGLLARNQDGNVDQAMRIIRNVIDGQFKDPKDQWYGDYQQYPEEPTVGTSAYPPIIYDTWDPNWRGFISTSFIIALEEFSHLIHADLANIMHASLYNATIGDSYRVGGIDGDNLYPSYTNPVSLHKRDMKKLHS